MRKVFPVVLMIVGVVMFGLGLSQAVTGVTSTVGNIASTTMIGAPFSAPGSSVTDLEPGTYTVYENVGYAGTRPGTLTVDPDSITVTGPDGTDVAATCISCGVSTSTLTLGSTTYIGVVSFTVSDAGEYTVESTDDSGATLVVGPDLAQAIGGIVNDLGGMFGWIGLAVLGGFLAVAGLIWLIVAAIMGRPKPAPVAGIPYYDGTAGATPVVTQSTAPVDVPPAPAGSWYPDPENPNQLRWWDGRQWTDQRRPR